jgi:ankyrin repeat protein
MNNNKRIFPSRSFHYPILRRTAAMLLVLLWGSIAFCDEIHDAAKKDDLEEVKALLKENPDLVSSKDESDETPLHLAVANGYKEMAELLLTHGADVTAKDNIGRTPLFFAAAKGY